MEMIALTKKLKNLKYELLMDYPDRDIPIIPKKNVELWTHYIPRSNSPAGSGDFVEGVFRSESSSWVYYKCREIGISLSR
jgi:hypothetical protein